MDQQASRDMSLREVANKAGKWHPAAKQFKVIENAVKKHRQNRWWNLYGYVEAISTINQAFFDIDRQEKM